MTDTLGHRREPVQDTPGAASTTTTTNPTTSTTRSITQHALHKDSPPARPRLTNPAPSEMTNLLDRRLAVGRLVVIEQAFHHAVILL